MHNTRRHFEVLRPPAGIPADIVSRARVLWSELQGVPVRAARSQELTVWQDGLCRWDPWSPEDISP